MRETFPIQWPYRRDDRVLCELHGCPREIPWAMIAPHEPQALRFHQQTLKRLAERGGLSPTEAIAVLLNRDWRPMAWPDASRELRGLVDDYERARRSEDDTKEVPV